jgi:hypothetical protein
MVLAAGCEADPAVLATDRAALAATATTGSYTGANGGA